MLCVDVNVLVYAHRPESPNHDGYRAWLENARRGVEPLGIPPIVLSGFQRVVTHLRIFSEPTPLDVALEFTEALRKSPAVVPVLPGERHWSIFTDLCRRLEARGNIAPDAFLAALAIEQGATWVSADRIFAGFPGLRWVHPLEP
ncbi:MAG: type II toxin-antitoxin system VapC family toxin [Actinobacteria bacterium]|nr:type II toxin-antitoxin system VapC family toxin [Actinomycetota bacterium]